MSGALRSLASIIKKGEGLTVFLTGAGVSVASGISAYRTGKDAVWNTFHTEWGTCGKFLQDPVTWWNSFWFGGLGKYMNVKPNAGHEALATLTKSQKCVVVTQNVDGLHVEAGTPKKALVEIHGRKGNYKCIGRGSSGLFSSPPCVFASERMLRSHELIPPLKEKDVEQLDSTTIPRCPECNDLVMPGVLFFDEYYASHDAFQFDQFHRKLIQEKSGETRYDTEWLTGSVLPSSKKYAKWEATSPAKALVLVGTSNSVGITQLALDLADRVDAKVFNMNLHLESDLDFDHIQHIIGPTEETLPLLLCTIKE